MPPDSDPVLEPTQIVTERVHPVEVHAQLEALANLDLELTFSEVTRAGTTLEATLRRLGVADPDWLHAVLRHHDSVFRNGFMRQVQQAATAPRERLLAIFDVAETWFRQNDFYGCMFINAVGEYSLEDTPIRQACKEFKGLMRGYFAKLSREAGATDPEQLADRLALLLEGAIVTAQVSQAPQAAKVARDAAAVLIDQAIPAGGPERVLPNPG